MSKLKLTIVIILGIIILGGIVAVVTFPHQILRAVIDRTSTQITPAEANKICQDFFQDVKSDITAIPDYTVLKGDKSCNPEQDEAGLTDYVLGVTFRVSKGAPDSVTALKNDINYLSKTLPAKNYPVFVDNVPGANGQPATICVNASRYIDNDGKDYPQGPPNHTPRYIEPGSIKGFASCANL